MTKNSDILNKIYEEAKAKRIVLNQTEFARALGKSRVTVFDRMMKSLEGIPQEVIDKALKLVDDTPNVSRGALNKKSKVENNELHEDDAPYGKALPQLISLLQQAHETFKEAIKKEQENVSNANDTIKRQHETIHLFAKKVLEPPDSNENRKHA